MSFVIALPYNYHLLPELYTKPFLMNVIIKEISMEDSPAINHLSNQLGYSISIEDTQNQINKILELRDHLALVAMVETTAIGWIHAFIALRIETKPFVEIGGLVVDENFRNKNVGRKLVDAIAVWCRKESISVLRVRCNAKRTETHVFYKKLNFIETKEQKIFQMNL
jgi:GNAT superfamily N-acetyltransferase